MLAVEEESIYGRSDGIGYETFERNKRDSVTVITLWRGFCDAL
jgi:hypothetical protein